MTFDALSGRESRRVWGTAGTVALGVHVVVIAVIFLWVRQAEPPVPEPVMLVEMLPEAAAAAPSESVSEPEPVRTQTPPIEVPPVKAPLPFDRVVLPPPEPVRPIPTEAAPQAAPMVSAPVVATASTPGSDAKAREQQMDYFALLAAHLNRKKSYPVEAKKARQEGIVTVRFTVNRDGQVSGISLKRGSGHDILDRSTLDLIQRVSPLPHMPASIQRDTLTLSLPIEYTLKTN